MKIKRKFKRVSLDFWDRGLLCNIVLTGHDDAVSPEKMYLINRSLDSLKYAEVKDHEMAIIEKQQESKDVIAPEERSGEIRELKLGRTVYLFIKECIRNKKWPTLTVEDIPRVVSLLERFNMSDEIIEKIEQSMFPDEAHDDEEWETE